MPDKTWDELTERLNELEQELTPLEEVSQTNQAVDELRAMLQSTAKGTEGAKEELEDYVGKLRDLGGEIEEYLDDPSVQELTSGVGEGLGEFQDALEAVDQEVGRLDEVLDQIQKYMEYEDAPADQQLEALADAFEQAVDKLGPLIKRIPGLGTFFEIYALAIRRIAESVGSIQATQRQLQKPWGQIRPGTTMYLVPRNAHERQQAAIREVELKLEENFNTMMAVAQELREQIPDAKPTEIDVAVRAAESRCSHLLPPTNAPELKARNPTPGRSWTTPRASETVPPMSWSEAPPKLIGTQRVWPRSGAPVGKDRRIRLLWWHGKRRRRGPVNGLGPGWRNVRPTSTRPCLDSRQPKVPGMRCVRPTSTV
jgi:hypothetical protein